MTTALSGYQPSLALTETIAMTGIFPSRDFPNDSMALGMFHTYGFTFGLAQAPAASGQLLPISQNTALFSVLGTTYGGDGRLTFALPDLGGRSSVSGGQGPGLNNIFQGEQSGSGEALLLQSHLPASAGGTSAPADEDQPELGVKYLIRTEGIYPQQGSGGAALNFIGSVVKFAGTFAPGSYLECDGQLLDIATHDALFSLIGTTYGGDGQSTFALPDLPWVTIVWNDPVNLQTYVAWVFRSYFGIPGSEADRLMLLVHNEGRAVVASGGREEMERHVEAMHDFGLWATLTRSDS